MILKSLEPRLPDLDIDLLVYYPSLACRKNSLITNRSTEVVLRQLKKTKQNNDRKEKRKEKTEASSRTI